MNATLENSPDITKDKDNIILKEVWQKLNHAVSILNYAKEINERAIINTQQASQLITVAYFQLESLDCNKDEV